MSLRRVLFLTLFAAFSSAGLTACDSQVPPENAAQDAAQPAENVAEKTEEVLKEADQDAKKEDQSN